MALKTKVQTEEKNNETKRCRSARRNCSYIQPYFLFEYKWTFKKISATTSVSLCPLKLEKVLQGNLGTDRARECIFRASIAHIFKMLPLNANHGGIFMGSMYVSVCPKKTPDTSLIRDPIILTYLSGLSTCSTFLAGWCDKFIKSQEWGQSCLWVTENTNEDWLFVLMTNFVIKMN